MKGKIFSRFLCITVVSILVFGGLFVLIIRDRTQKAKATSYEILDIDTLGAIGSDLDGDYTIMENIDASGVEWQPIGTPDEPFTGSITSYGGQPLKITGLTINAPDADYAGLFGYVGPGAVVQNITLSGVTISGHNKIGAMAGESEGTISNCSADGSVTGNDGTNGGEDVGGLVGRALPGSQTNNSSVAVSVSGKTDVGGLVGQASQTSSIENSYSSGTVNGITKTGGFAGINEGIIRNSYATGNVVSTGNYTGGFVGYIDATSTIDKVYSKGSVNGASYVGGLIGYINPSANTTITNSFYDAETSGQSASAGGISKTTAEMKDVSTYTNTDNIGLLSPWDFKSNPNDDIANEDIWNMMLVVNNHYPHFSRVLTLPFLSTADLEYIKPSSIPNIIYMNDFGLDCDGEIGLLMLAYLHHIGYANIEAVTSDKSLVQSKYVMDAILSSYGISDVPLGVYNLAQATFSGERAGYHPGQIDSLPLLRGSYEDSTVVLRRTLANAITAGKPITFVTNGPLMSMDGLLSSGVNYNGDGLPSGIELIQALPLGSKFICGAGYYWKNPSASNFSIGPAEANRVLSKWNSQLSLIPIYFMGEDGSDAKGRDDTGTYGGLMIGENIWPASNPAHWFWGYVAGEGVFGDDESFGKGYAESHDIIRTFYYIFGSAGFFELSAQGLASVNARSGAVTWTPTAGAKSWFVRSPLDPVPLNNLVARLAYTAAYEDITVPVVSGVTDGQITQDPLTITFDDGTATLNSVSFSSGTVVTLDGAYVLIVTDTFGNSTTINFIIDTDSPNIFVNDPASGSATTTSSTYTIKGAAEDATSGIASANINGVTISTPSNFSINVNLSLGINSFMITATDLAGNIARTPVTITRTESVVVVPPTPDRRNLFPRIFQPLVDIPSNGDNGITGIFNIFDGKNTKDLTKKLQTIFSRFPIFRGRTIPNARILFEIHSDEVIKGETTSDENGNWSYQVDKELSLGNHTVSITVIDSAGATFFQNVYKFFVMPEVSAPNAPSINYWQVIIYSILVMLLLCLYYYLNYVKPKYRMRRG